jgi:hypothetical protein
MFQLTTQGLPTMTTAFKYVDVVRLLHQLGLQKASGDITIQNLVSLTRLRAGLSSELTISRHSVPNASAASKATTTWLQARGYILCRLAQHWVCIREDNEAYPTAYVTVGGHQTTISIYAYGDADEVAAIKQWAGETFSSLGTLIQVAERIDGDGDIRYSRHHMTAETTNVAQDAFYPWLGIPLTDYFKAFMDSNESVLVLFGLAGTGKSTFLRSLIHSGRYVSTLACDPGVVESPILLREFYADTENPVILAYEDFDHYIKKREDGNPLMSALLNAADGVVAHPGKKLIFSTNLPTTASIDPALLRPGRCFDIQEFKPLTGPQAAAARASVGMEPKDFSGKDTWLLAEALQQNHPAIRSINRFARKVGF